jgi:hypothetical protein
MRSNFLIYTIFSIFLAGSLVGQENTEIPKLDNPMSVTYLKKLPN